MQKRILSDEQKRLITENYQCIYETLRDRVKFGQRISEALSYVPEATMEFRTEVSNGKKFHTFVAERCLLRLIDEYRDLNKQIRAKSHKRNAIEKIEVDNLLKNDGALNLEEFYKSLEEHGLSQKDVILSKEIKSEPLGNHSELTTKHNFIDDVDREDEIKGLEKQIDEFFVKLAGDSLQKRNFAVDIKKKLLKEYVIPRLKNMDFKTLSQIGKECGMTEGRICQLLKDESIKSFLRKFYGETDRDGRPIVKR